MDVEQCGGCQCGNLRYRITAAPKALVACHCSECQRQSGSAFGLSLVVAREHFVIDRGEPRSFSRMAASGNQVSCSFCSECGTRIFHEPRALPDNVNIKAGTLDDTSALEPVMHTWVASKQPWVPIPPGARSFEGNPG